MKKIPKRVLEPFMMFLTVIGYKAKMNSDLSMAASIGLWALPQKNWVCNEYSLNQRENWQGHGKRKKPKIK